MSDETKPRKIAFNLYPEEHAGDRLASDLLDNIRLKERGRAMRAFLLTGAALAAIDPRLPNLIAELANEDVTLKDIQRIISSVIPDAFAPYDAMVRALLSRLMAPGVEGETPPVKAPDATPENKDLVETRNNALKMFQSDDDD